MTKCSICKLPTAGTLNAALNEGQSARSVATEFDVSPASLYRHIASGHPARSAVVHPVAGADPMSELIQHLRRRALGGNDQASREYRLALLAQQEARNAVPPTVDLEASAEWHELRAKMLAALAPFPEARQAIADALA